MDTQFDIEDLEKFLQRLELEKRIGKNLLFVETNTQLESTVAFSQYIFSDIRLITMIGEIHEKSWTCPNRSITVSEYCKQAVQHNPNCRVMLEYNGGDDATRIGSEAIRDTYTALDKIGKLKNIIPFDSRSFFLGVEGHRDLYGDGYKKHTGSWEKIFSDFIEPFYQKQRDYAELFKLTGDYDREIKNYLETTYFLDMDQTFKDIAAMLGHVQGSEVHRALKDAWKKVSDFFILRDLLKNDNVDHYIVIVGKSHYNNLKNILSTTALRLNEQTGSSDKCVELYQTYRI